MSQSTRRVLVVANPTSGQGRGRRWLEAAESLLRPRGQLVDAVLTGRAGDAEERVRACTEATEVWAIGGDGTINEAVQGLGGRSRILGILPAGTGNVVARELGIPRRLEAALDIADSGPVLQADVGEADGRRFLFMLSGGLDAEVVRRIAERRHGATMHLWDYLPVLWSCREAEEPRFQIEVDGQPHGGVSWLGVFNVQRYAGLFRACPDADIRSGHLQVLLLRDPIAPRLLRVCQAMARGRLHRLPDGESLAVRRLKVAGAPVVQIDGDLAVMPGDFGVQVHPGELGIRVPRRS